jgi:hypothetical protein
VIAVPDGDIVRTEISLVLPYAVAPYAFRTVQGVAVHWAGHTARARTIHSHVRRNLGAPSFSHASTCAQQRRIQQSDAELYKSTCTIVNLCALSEGA